MAFDAADLERILKLTALINQGIVELQNILQNRRSQEGKTDLEIAEHAEKANAEARALIEAL